MRNLKISFIHPNYVYKFRVNLNVSENINMLSLDRRKIQSSFENIRAMLTLTSEESIMFESLSLGFRKEFVDQFLIAVNDRRNVDYLGQTAAEHVAYFEARLADPSEAIKELYIYFTRKSAHLADVCRLIEGPSTIKLLRQHIQLQNKDSQYTYFFCLAKLFQKSSAKLDCFQVSSLVMYSNKTLLLQYEHTHLTEVTQTFLDICSSFLSSCKDHSWIYTTDEQLNTSILKFIIGELMNRNRNFIIVNRSAEFIMQILRKCRNLNELLLFITECINMRIINVLDLIFEGLQCSQFQSRDCVYLSLIEDSMDSYSRKPIRLRERKCDESKWQKQISKGKQSILELKQEFVKFKSGKIQGNEKKVSHKDERERIRRQSFIMTTFEAVQKKYQQIGVPSAFENQEEIKLFKDNQELIKINKWYEEQLVEKNKSIRELQNAIAQFVDVKQKYSKNKNLQIQSSFSLHFEAQRKQHRLIRVPSTKINHSKESSRERELEGSPSTKNLALPILPAPPPYYSGKSHARGSRGSKQMRHLPLPPPPPPPEFVSLLSESSLPLPPPPPPPPFTLSPPTFKSSIKNGQKKKEIKIINWAIVQRSKVKDSFWQKVDEAEFNEEQLVQFFSRKQKKQQTVVQAQNAKEIKSLLKPDRAKNVEIVLKKTKIKFEVIPFAIAELNEQILTADNVDALLNIVPTQQQSDDFIELSIKDPSEWNTADLFFCLITKIAGYTETLKAIKFKFQFSEISKVVLRKINLFISYVQRLENDEFWQQFLTYMLSIGNYMNSDTTRGNAYGFRLQSIEKSYIVMGQDNKTSLFEYILQLMRKKGVTFPDKSYAVTDLVAPIEILKQDMRELNKLCGTVQQVLLMSDEDDDRTPEYFLSFYISCRQKLEIMDVKFNEAFQSYKKISDFYCEKMESEKLIKIVNEFRRRVVKFMEQNRSYK